MAIRICSKCQRAFVPLKTDLPNQQVCNSCRFSIPSPPRREAKP